MPIDIPSDKINSSTPPRSNNVEANATAKINTKQGSSSDGAILRAVVTEVINASQQKAQAQSIAVNAQAQKALYEAIITLNQTQTKTTSTSTSSVPPTTQLDAEAIQQITLGKPVAVRVQTNAQLEVGQQLKVQLQGQALKLMQIAPPDLKGVLQHFIRQEVNQQNSYALLLSKLMSIAQAIRQSNAQVVSSSTANTSTSASNTNPSGPNTANQNVANPNTIGTANQKAISNQALVKNANSQINNTQLATTNTTQTISATSQAAIASNEPPNVKALKPAIDRFMQALPNLKMVTNSEGLKQAIKNSGVFFEKNLLNPDLATTKPTATKPILAGSAKGPNPALLIQQIKQQIKQLKIAIQSQAVTTNDSSKALIAQSNLSTDLKLNLLTLQRQLESLEKQINTSIVKNKSTASETPAASSTNKTSDNVPTTKTNSPENALNADAKNIKGEKTQAMADNQGIKAAQKLDNALQANPDAKAKQVNEQKVIESLARENIARDNISRENIAKDNAAIANLAKAGSPVYQRPTPSQTPTQASNANVAHNSSSTSNDSAKQKSITDLIIQPPLPGKPLIQTQAIRPQSLAKESLADALISVLIKHTKEATSRLNLHQLTSVAESTRQDGGPPQTNLSFELPVVNGNDLALFQFRIQEEELEGHESKESQGKEKKWVVHMGFDLEGLGPMYCQITLIGISASVTFWAEEKATVSHSKQQLDDLREKLSNLGVNVKEIQCLEGSPPTDQSGIKQTLIDIET
ncbi:MAG: flagellar hook-length control protein FliK [Pseudomonadales bacterium]|nr:flagellar hook-length control protein FliK [Pseudomonadales bacterium]